MGDAPDLKPFMLRGLTYVQAVGAMKATGCATRRNHWCAPVLVIGPRGKPVLDDEGEIRPFRTSADDRTATDWEMVVNPAAGGDHG